MKIVFLTILFIGLIGCSPINQDSLNKLADTSFEVGFMSGINCMDKLNNIEDCYSVLQKAKEKLND